MKNTTKLIISGIVVSIGLSLNASATDVDERIRAYSKDGRFIGIVDGKTFERATFDQQAVGKSTVHTDIDPAKRPAVVIHLIQPSYSGYGIGVKPTADPLINQHLIKEERRSVNEHAIMALRAEVSAIQRQIANAQVSSLHINEFTLLTTIKGALFVSDLLSVDVARSWTSVDRIPVEVTKAIGAFQTKYGLERTERLDHQTVLFVTTKFSSKFDGLSFLYYDADQRQKG